ETLAKQLGVKIVRIVSYSEGGGYSYPEAAYSSKAVGMGGGDTAPQIQTGENKTEVTVSITYEFR
ncbi:MAG: SIMPL domain-containing protein, partial [Candidatus Paceibacterota bacterium]